MAASVEDDIAYLKDLAEAGSTGVPAGGWHFVVWAVVIATGLGLTYGAVTGVIPIGKDTLDYWWATALVVGWVASFVIGWLESSKPEALRSINRITTVTWVATGVSLTATCAGLMISGGAAQAVMMPIAGAAIGVATAVTAAVFRLRWLYLVATAWWIVAFASLLMMKSVEFLLFSAAAILLLQGGTGIALILLEGRRAR